MTAGLTRRARYALRRPLRGIREDLPLYAIDADGQGEWLAALSLVQPQGTLLPLNGTTWPVPPESRDGWWDGLPYPVHAIRPQGYLGRQFARAEGLSLGVAVDPESWSDVDILWVLSRRGFDASGNLLLGDESYELWLRNKVQGPAALPAGNLGEAYAQLAQRAVALGGGGSSVAGEFPKFTALRELDGSVTPHVLVKFSGAGGLVADWLAACATALEYWRNAAADSRVSASFRDICRANAARLARVAEKV